MSRKLRRPQSTATPQFERLIAGAGFAGALCARQLAEGGRRVLLIDRRSLTGGNAADGLDAHGARIHPNGPHIAYTHSETMFRNTIPRVENKALYQRYAALVEAEHSVSFVGRLAQYRDHNMDQGLAALLRGQALLTQTTAQS